MLLHVYDIVIKQEFVTLKQKPCRISFGENFPKIDNEVVHPGHSSYCITSHVLFLNCSLFIENWNFLPCRKGEKQIFWKFCITLLKISRYKWIVFSFQYQAIHVIFSLVIILLMKSQIFSIVMHAFRNFHPFWFKFLNEVKVLKSVSWMNSLWYVNN